MNGGLDVCLKLAYYLSLLDVNDDHWELDNLVERQILSLVFTLALEVIDYDVVEGRLVDEFSILHVQHLSEEIRR